MVSAARPSMRPDLDLVPTYVAGRSIPDAVKLASNETVFGPLPSVTKAIAEAADGANRYPDITSARLVEALADFLGCDAENVTVGCGSVALCQQLVQALCEPGDEVIIPWRSFEAYPIVTRIAHAQGVRVPLLADGRHDLDAMAAAITERTRLIFVCTPNNPTGPAVTATELRAFLDRVPTHVTVALDEAYYEYLRGPDRVDGVSEALNRPNIVSLRTFSKAYGLAGIRVGYLVGAPALVAAVAKMIVPFSVSSVAQAAAIASLQAGDELLARTESVVAERERVRAALLDFGYEVPVSQANFLWLGLGATASDFDEHCLATGVVIRCFAGDGVRVSIGAKEENDRFLQCAQTWAEAGAPPDQSSYPA